MQNKKGFTPLEVNNTQREHKKNKPLTGFTIIELIIVIAVVAVLAAIVLVNVVQYIAKAKNAAIKGNMASLLVEAAVYFDNNNSYTGFNTSEKFSSFVAAISESGGGSVIQNTTETAFCACSALAVTDADPEGSTYCIDSTGVKKQTTTECNTECDAIGVCL